MSPHVFFVIVALLGGVVWGVVLLPQLYRRPAWGLAFASAPLVWDALSPLPSVEIAGAAVDTAVDPAAVILLLVGVTRLVTTRAPSRVRLLVTVLITCFAFGIVRGVLFYGLGGALDVSDHLAIIAGIGYGASFRLTSQERHVIFLVLLSVAGLLSLVAVARLAGVVGADQDALDASATFVLAQTAVLLAVVALERGSGRSTSYLVWSGVLLGLVILLQHRSVWLATLIAILVLLPKFGRRSVSVVAAVIVAATALYIASVSDIDTGRSAYQADDVVSSTQLATSNADTLIWRQEYWSEIWRTHSARGSAAILFGAGYGAPWAQADAAVDVGPHNQYIEFLVRFGIVGGLAWVALLLWTLRWLWRTHKVGARGGLSNLALLSIVAAQVTWSMTYAVNRWQPLLLGLALGAAFTRSRTSVVATETAPRYRTPRLVEVAS